MEEDEDRAADAHRDRATVVGVESNEVGLSAKRLPEAEETPVMLWFFQSVSTFVSGRIMQGSKGENGIVLCVSPLQSLLSICLARLLRAARGNVRVIGLRGWAHATQNGGWSWFAKQGVG